MINKKGSRLQKKAFWIAKMTIIERKLNVLDCQHVLFGNLKRLSLAVGDAMLYKITRSSLSLIQCGISIYSTPLRNIRDAMIVAYGTNTKPIYKKYWDSLSETLMD